MKWSDKEIAYGLLRIAFGINFLLHGLIRIYSGVGAFAAKTVEQMGKSPMPHGFVNAFAHAIPFIEVLLGLALIFGVLTRATLICGAVFMMALTIGVASNQEWNVAGQQLLYSVVFFLLLFLREYNGLAVERRFRA